MSEPRRAEPSPLPLYARVALLRPRDVEAALERIRATGAIRDVPNTWQIFLGVARMWHRLVFRSETIGTCKSHPIRHTVRARLLAFRPLRFPFLLRERAIAPLDFSGLLSSRERVLTHLMGAHHDENQFAYDLEMLALRRDGALEELLGRVERLLADDGPRARFLRDLAVFEGYHEHLAEAVRRALAGDYGLSDAERDDPDISFRAYLAWCARQPATPEATWAALRGGHYHVAEGLC
jgi:hypothetical protein